jgi:hypothetical protein
MNALEIVKKTLRTNCGECGYPACMAFAVAVVSSGEKLSSCPYIKTGDMDNNRGGGVRLVSDPDTVLLRTLKAKVRSIDIAERAQKLGGTMVNQDGSSMLRLQYLGDTILISDERAASSSGAELDPRDQILLYNYLFSGGAGTLSGEWVGLESFPNSISKVVTLKRYTEDKLAVEFENRGDELRDALFAIKAREIESCHADMCLVVPVLPMVPIQVHFWDSDDEDGFPASVKVLFDSSALEFLDIESLIFATERMTEKVCGQT